MLDFRRLEKFEWDRGNLEHIKKHLVDYKEVEQIFLNKPLLVKTDEAHSIKEIGYRVLGNTNKERLLLIVFTIRGGSVRIVTARDQNKKEKKIYKY